MPSGQRPHAGAATWQAALPRLPGRSRNANPLRPPHLKPNRAEELGVGELRLAGPRVRRH
jgi:hypothetical protein